jgi:transcriptional regulator with XRE-family HTH domain
VAGEAPSPLVRVESLEDFTRELVALVDGSGLSLEEIASRARMSRRALDKFLRGETLPSRSILKTLLTVLNVSEPDRSLWERAQETVERRQIFVRKAEYELHRLVDAISMRTATSPVVGAPVVLYLDDTATYEEVLHRLNEALMAFGQEVILASKPVFGSIWQGFVAIFKRQVTPRRVEDAMVKVQAGAVARWYGEPQSQITKAQGEAIASLLTALEGNQNALLTFSNILVLKVDGVPLVRELTPEQVEHLQKNPRLYTNPGLALAMLDEGRTAPGDAASGPGQQAVTS